MAELGQTDDPRQLIPGDPNAIAENVAAVGGRGDAMQRAGDGLRRIDSGSWQGPAGDAFRERFAPAPSRWFQASDAFTNTAKALAGYMDTLGWAQGQAAEAIHLFAEGNAATDRARHEYDKVVAAANAQTNAETPTTPPVFLDPGEEKRQAARDMLGRARQQVTEAGDRAATAIGVEAEKAPERSPWESIWGGVTDVADFVGDVGVGLWDGVTATADFLWELSPHHLFEDPDHYSKVWDQVTSAASFAAEHPIAFAKEMINWDEWGDRPGRALGNTLFAVLPALGAAGKAGKLGKPRELEHVKVKPRLEHYFGPGVTPKATDLEAYALAQGWKFKRDPGGPRKYVDENGVERMIIKQGSPRTAGSNMPHVALRDATGQRIDPYGTPVSRRDPRNHTLIDMDM